MKKHPEVTVGALIFHKEKILLIKSWKWGNRYTLPRGHVEVGEKLKDVVKKALNLNINSFTKKQ